MASDEEEAHALIDDVLDQVKLALVRVPFTYFPNMPPTGNPTAVAPLSFTDFPQFSNFPSELRCKIFAQALTQVFRNVRVKVDNGYVTGSSTPPPVILHINKEARYEALRHLRVLVPDERAVKIYYLPDNDTIEFYDDAAYFGVVGEFVSRRSVPLFKSPTAILELGNITSLRLTDVPLADELLVWAVQFSDRGGGHPILNNLRPFTGLKKVEVIMSKFTDSRLRLNYVRYIGHEAFVFLNSIVAITRPVIYNATGKATLEVTDHKGNMIGRFWGESYDNTPVVPAVNNAEADGKVANSESDDYEPPDYVDNSESDDYEPPDYVDNSESDGYEPPDYVDNSESDDYEAPDYID